MEPRVRTTLPELAQQFALSKELYDDLLKASSALEEIHKLQSKTPEIAALEGAAAGRGRGAPAGGPDSLTSVSPALSTLLRQIEAADAAPPTQASAAAADRRKALSALLAQWKTMR